MEAIMRIVAPLAALLITFSAAAHAQQPSDTIVGPIKSKPALTLTDQQKKQVVDAVSKEDALDKLPDGFEPAVGAKVPTQKKLAEHPFPRPLVNEVPALKQYYYARLEHRLLIVDPMTKKVALILPM
jgi:hypothetical protein